MPKREDNPITYTPMKRDQMKRNASHIDGGEIYEALGKFLDSKPKKIYDSISPSALGGCPRAHWFELMGYPHTIEVGVGTRATWEIGHQYEAMMEKVFEHSKMLIHHFTDEERWFHKITGQTLLGGSPDFLINYQGKVTVADAKTARDDSFQYVGPTQTELKAEKMQYWWQTIAYLYLLNKNTDRLKKEFGIKKVEQGLIFIYNKENGIVQRELLVKPTANDIRYIEDKSKMIWSHFKDKTPPTCTCGVSKWELEYCHYGDPKTRVTNRRGKVVNTACCELEWVGSVVQ